MLHDAHYYPQFHAGLGFPSYKIACPGRGSPKRIRKGMSSSIWHVYQRPKKEFQSIYSSRNIVWQKEFYLSETHATYHPHLTLI